MSAKDKKGLIINGSDYKLNYLEKGFILLCLLIYSYWAFNLPYDFGPDEYMRYAIPKYIFENGCLPKGDEETLRNPIYGFSYGFFITIPYLTSALFMKIISFFNDSEQALLFAARITSVLSISGVNYFAIKISKSITKNITRWVMIITIGLWPQIIFLSSYVNNDSFGLFIAFAIVYCWIKSIETRWSYKTNILLGLLLGLCYLSYKIYYLMIIFSIIIYIYDNLKRREKDFKRISVDFAVVFCFALIICGWQIIRAAYFYNGDILDFHTSAYYGELFGREDFKPSNHLTFYESGISLRGMLINSQFGKSTINSFIGTFGYMNIIAGYRFYYSYYIILILAIAGLYIFLFKQNILDFTMKRQSKIVYYLMLFITVFQIVMHIMNSYLNDYQPQGRYIMILILPISFSLIVSIEYLKTVVNRTKLNRYTEWISRIAIILYSTFLVYSAYYCYMLCINNA